MLYKQLQNLLYKYSYVRLFTEQHQFTISPFAFQQLYHVYLNKLQLRYRKITFATLSDNVGIHSIPQQIIQFTTNIPFILQYFIDALWCAVRVVYLICGVTDVLPQRSCLVPPPPHLPPYHFNLLQSPPHPSTPPLSPQIINKLLLLFIEQ